MNTEKEILKNVSNQLEASTKTSWTSADFDAWVTFGKRMRNVIETVVPILRTIANSKDEPKQEPVRNFIYDAQKTTAYLQENVIGLFRIYGTQQLTLVVEKERELLKVVSVSQLGVISVIHIPSEKGKLHMFDEGVTLATIKYDAPFELMKITDELKKD